MQSSWRCITMASRWHCSDASNEMPQLMIFCVCFCHITLQLRRVKRKNLVSRTCWPARRTKKIGAPAKEARTGKDAGMQGCILAHLHSCFTWNYDCVVLTLYEHLWMQKLELNKTNKMCFLGSTMLLPHANRSNIWNCIVQNWRRPGRVI